MRRVRLMLLLSTLAALAVGTALGGSDPPHGELDFFLHCLNCHEPGPGLPDGTATCLQCHTENPDWWLDPGRVVGAHASAITGTQRFEYELACTDCHDPHYQEQDFAFGTDYGKYIRTIIDEEITVTDLTVSPPESFTTSVLSFIEFTGPTQFVDTDFDPTEDICRTCHTRTNHHQNDGDAPWGQSHYDGTDCTQCHSHATGFAPIGGSGGPHPQAITDCSNCHLNPTTGEPDLQSLHGFNCGLCHVGGFGGSFLGPSGSWGGECSSCHNPAVPETGFLPTPTKGHRCVVCHGEQFGTADPEGIHEQHTDKANCVVCHGFVPDTAVTIGSGNRENCHLCHGTSEDDAGIERIHKKMVPEGLSCVECHAQGRPAVDANEVCRICHDDEDPDDFASDSKKLHRKHSDERLDCGACHADAQLQDDAIPMPPVDDARRGLLTRSAYSECGFCHSGNRTDSARKVHDKHVADQWQWCFNCHEGADQRPVGDVPPLTQPAESCRLCHRSRTYGDAYPFEVHEAHARENKCYACHQAEAPILNWPREWLTAN